MAEADSSQEENDREIVTPGNFKSTVWKYFGFWSVNGEIVSKKKVVCKLCNVELSYHTTTTNLKNHLQSAHPAEHDEMSGTPANKQPRLDGYFAPRVTSELSAARQEFCLKKLAFFIAKDMRPISTVEGVGFKEFCAALEPRFVVPCRATVSDRIVKLYESTKEGVMASVRDKPVSLTTDGWTSLATDAYVTVTAHWISDDWNMYNKVLQTAELKETHTAAHVGACIQRVLDGFGVEGGAVTAIATDNAANYKNAVERHLDTVNIPCVAHTLNLAVRKGLGVRAIETPVSRLKAAAAHFNHSTTDSYLLEAKQEMLGLPKEKLINDCPTRWNSTHEMICRAAKQQAAVSAVIFDKKLSKLELTTGEWTLIEKVSSINSLKYVELYINVT